MKPTVFHVITDRNIGGGGLFLWHLLKGRAHDDDTIGSHVLLPRGSLLCERFAASGIPFSTFRQEKEASFSADAVRCFCEIFQRKSPTLVVAHASLSARVAAKRLKIPTLSVRHCDTPFSSLLVPVYNAFTDATVATSAPCAMHLRKKGIKNVFAVENGAPTVFFPTEKEKETAKAALSLPKEKIAIGLCARLALIKGHKTALEAFARLERKEDFCLCFLGCGEEEKNLKEMAKRLHIAEHVHFLGFSEDPATFFHAMDAHISCSLGSETSSLSLAEGLCAGCLTFATDTEGNRLRLGDGGVCFPIGDASALSRLFASLKDPFQYEKLANAAKARALSLPSWEEVYLFLRRIFLAFCGELVANGCFFTKDMVQ